MAKVLKTLEELMSEKHNMLRCSCCDTSKASTLFYITASRNAITRADMQGRTRMTVCKSCLGELYEYFFNIFRTKEQALYQLCGAYDIYYDEDIVQTMKAIDTTKYIETYMSLLEGDKKYSAKTFVDSVNNELSLPQAKREEDEETLSEEDDKNRREIITIYHNDPFENEPMKIRKHLYHNLTTMIDDSLREDLVRQRAALEIVRAFARIDKWTATIDEWSNDPEKMRRFQKELKELIAMKQKETDMVTKFSKDHGFAERYATSKSRGSGTLSGVMRDMEDYNFDDGKVNFYDIKTSASMQQASDISTASIMKQLSLQEADYVAMVKEQRELNVTLQTELNRAREENRIIYKAVKKQDLLKELATELINAGMGDDEVSQAILAEINFDEEKVKKLKRNKNS